MTARDTLDWLDIGRGLLTLAGKARPLARTVATLVRHRDSSRISLGLALEHTARAHPDAIAVKHERGILTYRALNQWANRIAHHLMRRGLRHGDAVAVLMENRPALLAVIAAVAKVGGISALINTNLRRQPLVHSFRCFTPALYLIGEELLDPFEEIRAELGPIAPGTLHLVADPGQSAEPTAEQLAESTAEQLAEPTAKRPTQSAAKGPPCYTDLDQATSAQPVENPVTTGQVRFGDPCCYIFTSGTTGLPKASIMSHGRWIKAASAFGESCLNLRPGETIYAPLPLYHSLALSVAWSSAVYTGAALAIRRKLSVSAFWDDCRRYQADAFAYIGEIPRYLLNQPPDPRDRANPVRKVIGVGLRPELWEPLKSRFGVEEVYEIYAASEMNVSFLNVMNLDRTVGFCPMRWALVSFDVDEGEPRRDARGHLLRVGKGEVGLLITEVTKRFRFEGYTDAEASERKLLRNVFRDGDVWFNSGDLMRDIGFGHLRFVDRVGDTFRWKSENVATGQVEAIIGTSGQVADCTVYGVELPGLPGRAGMAAVVPAGGSLDADVLLAHLRAELPSYAIPVFLRITDTLEVTGTFKHRKVELRREGYDPTGTPDPILVLQPGSDAYTRLTPELHARIQRGDIRF